MTPPRGLVQEERALCRTVQKQYQTGGVPNLSLGGVRVSISTQVLVPDGPFLAAVIQPLLCPTVSAHWYSFHCWPILCIDNRTLFGLCSGHGLQAWYGTIFKYSYSVYINQQLIKLIGLPQKGQTDLQHTKVQLEHIIYLLTIHISFID